MMRIAGKNDKNGRVNGVKVAQILMAAGCRPSTMCTEIKAALNAILRQGSRKTRSKRKETVRDMKKIGVTVQSLEVLSRAIHRQLRGITGTTYHQVQKLDTTLLTNVSLDFLKFKLAATDLNIH